MVAPKDNPARRNARLGPLQLPAEGRSGRAPAWPLAGRLRAGEQEAWRELWRTPQAVAWERVGWVRVVGRYCRVLVESERTLDSKLLAEVRQLEDRLGLTPKSMRLLLWSVVGDTVGEQRRRRREESRVVAVDPRERIKAVE